MEEQVQEIIEKKKEKDISSFRWQIRYATILVVIAMLFSFLMAYPFGGCLSVYSSILEFFGWFG